MAAISTTQLLFVVYVVLLAGASHGAAPGVQTGTATWSGPADSARKDYSAYCYFGETVLTAPFNKMVTGFGEGSDECGVCYKVICKGHPSCSPEGVAVTVTDTCRDPDSLCRLDPFKPEARSTHFDMGGYAFGAMALSGRADELRAATADGPVHVTFEWTNCAYARPNDTVIYPAFRTVPEATNQEFGVVLIYTEWSAFWPTVQVRVKSAGDKEWRAMKHFRGAAWLCKDEQNNPFSVTPPLSFQVDSLLVGSTEVKTVTIADVIPVGWEITKVYYGHA